MSKEKIKYVKLESYNPNEMHPDYACFTLNCGDDEEFYNKQVGFVPYHNCIFIQKTLAGDLYAIQTANYYTSSLLYGKFKVTEISREQFVHEYDMAITQLCAKAGIVDFQINLK